MKANSKPDTATVARNTSGNDGSLQQAEDTKPTEEGNENTSVGQALKIKLPANPQVLDEIRALAAEPAFRVEVLASCVKRDPVIMLELIRVANSMYFNQGRPPMTTAETAIVQLGSKQLIEIADSIATHKQFSDEETANAFESLRIKAQKIAAVARLLGQATKSDLAGELQTVGLMSVIGNMLACAHLGSTYAKLAKKLKRAPLAYRLASAHGFDTNFMQLSYLRRNGFPEVLLFALDREVSSKTAHRTGMRNILHAAIELVDAFEDQQSYRFQPGTSLPSQSSLRLLQLNQGGYQNIWDNCYSLLTDGSVNEVQTDSDKLTIPADPKEHTPNAGNLPQAEPTGGPTQILDNRDFQLLTELQSAENVPQTESLSSTQTATYAEQIEGEANISQKLNDEPSYFPLPSPPPVSFIKTEKVEVTRLSHYMRFNKRITNIISEFATICETANSTTQLLDMLLNFLVTDGPFARAALIAHSNNRTSAKILRSIGDGFKDSNSFDIYDPISPLATCTTQLKSFNAHSSKENLAPLGISAYAMSPLDIHYEDPISLYADCGSNKPITFEARRIFRYIVGLLNTRLPEIDDTLFDKSQ
ncbi:MAG: HDOD domain-containing protein [Deltaproteobacteria bacterium]|nr:HDOD domain-containing protein [Deltaproteobacteria bacterium]